tara:strand:+ start:333 stop:530 length:198 start_codon:yes stop_codon:yes gene_type:complete
VRKWQITRTKILINYKALNLQRTSFGEKLLKNLKEVDLKLFEKSKLKVLNNGFFKFKKKFTFKND